METKSETNSPPPPPLCVFCSAPWTDEMVKIFASADEYHGYYEGEQWVQAIEVEIDVTCATCNRLVYRKEIRDEHPTIYQTG